MGYYAMMDECDDIIGGCYLFIYLNINCVIIEYRDYYRHKTKTNPEYTLEFANAILNTFPTKYKIQYTSKTQGQIKLLEVDTKDLLNCLELYLEAGFKIHHDDYNNNIEITMHINKRGNFRRLIEHLNSLTFPEEKLKINSINDFY